MRVLRNEFPRRRARTPGGVTAPPRGFSTPTNRQSVIGNVNSSSNILQSGPWLDICPRKKPVTGCPFASPGWRGGVSHRDGGWVAKRLLFHSASRSIPLIRLPPHYGWATMRASCTCLPGQGLSRPGVATIGPVESGNARWPFTNPLWELWLNHWAAEGLCTTFENSSSAAIKERRGPEGVS